MARTLVDFAYVECVVRREPVEHAARRLGVPLATGPVRPGRDHLDRFERRRVAAVRRVAGWWPLGRGPCLREALVLGRLLPHLNPQLRLGVARRGGEMVAHAWVDVDGVLIGGAQHMVELTGVRKGT